MSRAIQTPGPSRQLEKRYAIKGALGLQLDETIVPVELILPVPRKYAIGMATAAAAAGFRSEVALVNTLPFGPSSQDTSVWVHKLWISAGGANTSVDLVRTTAGIMGFSNATTKSFVNLPLGLSPTAVISSKNSAVATAGTIIARRRLLASDSLLVDLEDTPIVLDTTVAGAQTLVVRPSSDNVEITCTLLWSEPAPPV